MNQFIFGLVLSIAVTNALQCYIGVSVKLGDSLIPIGGAVTPCNGECSNTTIYGTSMHMCDTDSIVNMYTFSRNLCVWSYCTLQSQLQSCCYKLIHLLIYLQQFSLSNSCDNEAQNISGCCCDTGDNCNFPGVPPTLAPGNNIRLFMSSTFDDYRRYIATTEDMFCWYCNCRQYTRYRCVTRLRWRLC